jgi:RNA polymerase sigma-70 factor (ECF subfamily)
MDGGRVGLPEDFEAVYRRHYAGVLSTVQAVVRDPSVAEELTQDVFLRFWRRPERYEPSRGGLGLYLRVLGRSRAIDAWRSERVGSRAHERLAHRLRATPATSDEPVVELTRRAETIELLNAVSTLPAAQREVVVLAYWGAMTSGEIALRTNVPVGTAKSRLRLALARLRGELEAPRRCDALAQERSRPPRGGSGRNDEIPTPYEEP